jgi:6-phosphogluconolactonase (cycloisomerase 2 family)
MKNCKLKIFTSIFAAAMLTLAACGGGSDGGYGAAGADSSFAGTGYAIDDYIVGGTVNIYQNNTDNLIESTTTGDYGKFQWTDKVKGVVRIEVTGGYEDIDGLASTQNDHVLFNRKLILLMDASASSLPVIVSPITTGIAIYASGDFSKYTVSVDRLDPSLRSLVVSSTAARDDATLTESLETIKATTRYLSYDSIVSELSDDGAFNNSAGLDNSVAISVPVSAGARGEITSIADSGLRSCISDTLKKEVSSISQLDLTQIKALYCTGYNITSVAGIDSLINLESFISSNSDISDISPLANLPVLSALSVANNRVGSIAPLLSGKFSRLELQISDNCVRDIPLLSSTTNISYIYGNPNHQYLDCYKNDADVYTFNPQIKKITGGYFLSYRASYNAAAVCAIDWGDGSSSSANCDARNYYVDHSYPSPPTQPVRFLVNGVVKKEGYFPVDCPAGQMLQNGVCVTPGVKSHFAYVTTGKGISAFRIDSSTGALIELSGSPFVGGGSLGIGPDGKFVYAVNHDDNRISAYAVNGITGVLNEVAGSPFIAGNDPTSIKIHPSGRFAYVTDFITVGRWLVDSATGALTQLFGVVGGGGLIFTSVAMDPDGKFIYIADYTRDRIGAYSINEATGFAASWLGDSQLAAGSGPWAIVVHPSGKFIYVVNRLLPRVSAYRVDSATGALTEIAGSPYMANSTALAAAIDPDGKFIYIVGNSSIMAYSINSITGALTSMPNVLFPGATRSITVDPTGKFAFVTGLNSASVFSPPPARIVAYSINSVTGMLTQAGTPYDINGGGEAGEIVITP